MSAMTANSNLHFHMDTNMSVVVVVEKHVAMALWFLASGADYRTIAHLFGVSKGLVCMAVKEQ